MRPFPGKLLLRVPRKCVLQTRLEVWHIKLEDVHQQPPVHLMLRIHDAAAELSIERVGWRMMRTVDFHPVHAEGEEDIENVKNQLQ